MQICADLEEMGTCERFTSVAAPCFLALLRDGVVRSASAPNEHIARLAELAARHADRKPDLAAFARFV